MFGLGGQELLIVLVIVLVLFGGKKIPELLRGVGKGVGELQKGLHEGKNVIERSYQEELEEKDRGAKKRNRQDELPGNEGDPEAPRPADDKTTSDQR